MARYYITDWYYNAGSIMLTFLSDIYLPVIISATAAVILSVWRLFHGLHSLPDTEIHLWKRLGVLVFSITLLTSAAVPPNVIAYRRAWALLYPDKRPAGDNPSWAGMDDYRDVRFSTPDGVNIAAWYVPGRLPATVVFLNGYTTNRSRFLPEAQLLNGAGFNVLLMDCRACGDSSGSLNTFGLYEVNDVRGAIQFLAQQPGVDPQRIGLVGHSQGGATAILAAKDISAVKAVVTISTFTSLQDNLNSMARNVIGLPPFPFVEMVVFWGEQITGLDLGQIRPIDAISAIAPRPVLIVHGDQDAWVPVDNAYKLYAAARPPKDLLIVPGATHHDAAARGGQVFKQKLLALMQQYLLPDPISSQ